MHVLKERTLLVKIHCIAGQVKASCHYDVQCDPCHGILDLTYGVYKFLQAPGGQCSYWRMSVRQSHGDSSLRLVQSCISIMQRLCVSRFVNTSISRLEPYSCSFLDRPRHLSTTIGILLLHGDGLILCRHSSMVRAFVTASQYGLV